MPDMFSLRQGENNSVLKNQDWHDMLQKKKYKKQKNYRRWTGPGVELKKVKQLSEHELVGKLSCFTN